MLQNRLRKLPNESARFGVWPSNLHHNDDLFVFLILLLNDKETMGTYTNTRFQNFANVSIVAMIIVISTLYGISALFPNLIGQ